MNIHDAAKILSLSGTVTPQDIKQAYRKAALQYHPDKNPAGSEMMKIINAAYDVLKDYEGELLSSVDGEGSAQNYSYEVNVALNIAINLDGLSIEICGAWVWISGNTYKYKAVLKEAGFKYASKKKLWYFRPDDWTSKSRGSYSMDDIRGKYGSVSPGQKQQVVLGGHHA